MPFRADVHPKNNMVEQANIVESGASIEAEICPHEANLHERCKPVFWRIKSGPKLDEI